MTGILETWECKGYRFQVDGERLKVEAPDHLLIPQVIEQFRILKAAIMTEYRLRNFVRLVRAFGTSHGLLLNDDVILAELDDVDQTELMTSELRDRQVWAELLAYRLCHQEPKP